VLDELYDKQKEARGRWAAFAWIASGVYLFATVEGARFLSWQAAVFFIVGMFAAAVVFGLAAYLIQRGIAKVLVRAIGEPTARTATFVRVIGLMLHFLETVAVFLIARWALLQIV
jgi:hypothetical protein